MCFNAYYNTWGQDQLSLSFVGKESFHAHREGSTGWQQTVIESKHGLYLVPRYFTGKYCSYINQTGENRGKNKVIFPYTVACALQEVDTHINARFFFTFAIVVC